MSCFRYHVKDRSLMWHTHIPKPGCRVLQNVGMSNKQNVVLKKQINNLGNNMNPLEAQKRMCQELWIKLSMSVWTKLLEGEEDTVYQNVIATNRKNIFFKAKKGRIWSTFLMVSNMDLPPCHGFEFFLMHVKLAMLCHFRSSSFLWKAFASKSTVSYM